MRKYFIKNRTALGKHYTAVVNGVSKQLSLFPGQKIEILADNVKGSSGVLVKSLPYDDGKKELPKPSVKVDDTESTKPETKEEVKSDETEVSEESKSTSEVVDEPKKVKSSRRKKKKSDDES